MEKLKHTKGPDIIPQHSLIKALDIAEILFEEEGYHTQFLKEIRRKLQAAEEMAEALKRAAAIDPNIMSPNLEAALAAWENAGKEKGK